jgi:predicted regulator of Ras-like GTPase activity (Roadblock/LC7/MglB family)
MRRILKQLNEVVGVKGSLVVTKDGIVIASHLGRQLEEDVVAAMAANVVLSTRRTLEGNGLRHFSRFTLVATHGKMVFTDAGPAFLVVVMDRNVELAPVDIEVESAAMRIRNLGEIRV